MLTMSLQDRLLYHSTCYSNHAGSTLLHTCLLVLFKSQHLDRVFGVRVLLIYSVVSLSIVCLAHITHLGPNDLVLPMFGALCVLVLIQHISAAGESLGKPADGGEQHVPMPTSSSSSGGDFHVHTHHHLHISFAELATQP